MEIDAEALFSRPDARIAIVNRPYNARQTVARLKSLHSHLPLAAFAELKDIVSGRQRSIGTVSRYFDANECTRIMGSGSYGTAFRICKSSGCGDCILLKIIDGKSEQYAEDLMIEADIHEALTILVNARRKVGGQHVVGCPHIPPLIKHVKRSPYLFLFMNLVRDADTLLNFLFSKRGEATMHKKALDLRGVFFSVLYFLACAQSALPNFRHNDLHASNALVGKPSTQNTTYILAAGPHVQYFVLPPGTHTCTVIDFGMSSSNSFHNQVAKDLEKSGIGTQPCDLYDLHYLVDEILEKVEELSEKSAEGFAEFKTAIHRWISPRFFRSGKLYSRQHKRLTLVGQSELQNAPHPTPLEILLYDP
jgi:hypothetical protein